MEIKYQIHVGYWKEKKMGEFPSKQRVYECFLWRTTAKVWSNLNQEKHKHKL